MHEYSTNIVSVYMESKLWFWAKSFLVWVFNKSLASLTVFVGSGGVHQLVPKEHFDAAEKYAKVCI